MAKKNKLAATPSIEEYAQSLMEQQKLEQVYIAGGFVFPNECDVRLYVGKNGKYDTVKRATQAVVIESPQGVDPVDAQDPIDSEAPIPSIDSVNPGPEPAK